MNADKHSPASSAWSTKRWVRGCLCQWELKAPTDRSRSDCVHEQVAKRIANVRFTVLRSMEISVADPGGCMAAFRWERQNSVLHQSRQLQIDLLREHSRMAASDSGMNLRRNAAASVRRMLLTGNFAASSVFRALLIGNYAAA